jgi:hypothetical protein
LERRQIVSVDSGLGKVTESRVHAVHWRVSGGGAVDERPGLEHTRSSIGHQTDRGSVIGNRQKLR